jgi:acetylornithine aminotransferase
VSQLLAPGQHGSTFGGNPVATAAGLATLAVLEDTGALEHARTLGEHLRAGIAGVPGVTEVRGRGLLIGFDLEETSAPAAVQAALAAGFIINSTGPRTLRIAPPLILTGDQADSFLTALPGILTTAQGAPS